MSQNFLLYEKPKQRYQLNLTVTYPLLHELVSSNYSVKVEENNDKPEEASTKLKITFKVDSSLSGLLKVELKGGRHTFSGSGSTSGIVCAEGERLQVQPNPSGGSIATFRNGKLQWTPGSGNGICIGQGGQISWEPVEECE